MEQLSRDVDALRVAEGATLILTPDYATTGWLSFYSPTQPAPVFQTFERERWIQEPPLPEAWATGPFLMVLPAGTSPEGMETELGPAVRRATIERRRADDIIARYDVYLIPRRAMAAL
jgi:hypothetical protein